jgi:hypothetical protein
MQILSIAARRMDDPEPDLSWLADESTTSASPPMPSRADAYGVDWYMIGIDAVARIVVNGVCQTLTSGGLWGIEDDSGEEYLSSIEDEQTEELHRILLDLGFSLDDIRAAS